MHAVALVKVEAVEDSDEVEILDLLLEKQFVHRKDDQRAATMRRRRVRWRSGRERRMVKWMRSIDGVGFQKVGARRCSPICGEPETSSTRSRSRDAPFDDHRRGCWLAVSSPVRDGHGEFVDVLAGMRGS